MNESSPELNEKITLLLSQGEKVLDGLRSVANEASQSQLTFLENARPLFDEADLLLEKAGMGGVVRPALDHLASAWFAVLQREVRYYGLLSEIEAIHEELFALVRRDPAG